MRSDKYWFIIPAVLVLSFFAIANLPMQIASVATGYDLRYFPDQEPLGDPAELPVSAGWPRVFYDCYTYPEPAADYVTWSMADLLLDVGIAISVAMTIGSLVYFLNRNRRVSRKSSGVSVDAAANSDDRDTESKTSLWRSVRSGRLRLQISDLAMLTLLFALPLGYFQLLKRYAEQDRQRIESLGSEASSVREVIASKRTFEGLPTWLKGDAIVKAMRRTTQLHLTNPSNEQLQTALTMPHLRLLVIAGDSYDLKHLQSLPMHRRLSCLQISGRTLDDATLQRISEMGNLRKLNLDRTNVTAETIAKLFGNSNERASRLVKLSLIDSAVSLDELNSSRIVEQFRSLESLHLPRPRPSSPETSSTFRCQSLQRLRELDVLSLDRGLNEQVLRLEIADCPKLAQLRLDQLQKTSIRLEHLPKLSEIELVDYKSDMRVTSEQRVPGGLWLDSLEITDVPHFETINFYAGDINRLDCRLTPDLRSAKASVMRRDVSGPREIHRLDKSISETAIDAIVQGVAASDGLASVDLSGVPLAAGRVDLSPMLENPKLVNLYLHGCGLKAADFAKFSDAKHLQELSSQGSDLSGRQLAAIIAKLPSLHRWYAATYQIDRLRVEDHSQIRGIVERLPEELGAQQAHLPSCDALHLVNLPEWNVPIRLDASQVQHLVIDRLPKLEELVINCPVPKGTVLSGLSSLRSVSAGGENLTDEVISDWKTYQHLDDFRLYYPGISAGGFRELLNNRQPAFLEILSDQLDDDAILGLRPTDLTVISLEGPAFSEPAVEHLLKSEKLVAFSLLDTPLSAAAVDLIIKQTSLQDLTINAAGLTVEQIVNLNKGVQLRRLRLRNLKFDATLVKQLIESNARYEQLVLVDAEVNSSSLAALMQSRRELKIQLVDTTISAILEGKLFDSGRLVEAFRKNADMVRYRGPGGRPIPIVFRENLFLPGPPYIAMERGVFRSLDRSRFETPNAVLFP